MGGFRRDRDETGMIPPMGSAEEASGGMHGVGVCGDSYLIVCGGRSREAEREDEFGHHLSVVVRRFSRF